MFFLYHMKWYTIHDKNMLVSYTTEITTVLKESKYFTVNGNELIVISYSAL